MTTQARDTGGDHVVSRVFCVGPVRNSEVATPGGLWPPAAGILASVVFCVAASVSLAAGADPVAMVNGQRLEAWELDRELATRISVGSYHRQISGERTNELRCQALQGLVHKELKRQWARDNPVDVDPAVAEAAWQEVRERFSSDEQYHAALDSKGITEEMFRQAFHRDAVAEAVTESLVSGVNPPGETEVEVYFILHGDEYMSPEARHVIHVLLYVPPSSSREDWEDAEQRARDLVQAVSGGETMLLDAAKPILEGLPPRFRDQVGDIGFVHRGSLLPAVDEVVFAADVGTVTEPVSTIYGYHILQVISTRPSQPIELAAVRDAVEARIITEQQQRRLVNLERELLDGAKIEVSECTESF